MTVSVRYAFFCEDVRTEVGGKTMAAGLWGAAIVVPEFAAVLRTLCFHAYVDNPTRAVTTFEMTMTGPMEPKAEGVFKGQLPIDLGKTGTNLNFIFGPVKLTGPGEIAVALVLQPAGLAAVEAKFTIGVIDIATLKAKG